MTELKQKLAQLFDLQPDLKLLTELVSEQQIVAWLVGGVLRDLLLGRQIADIDLVTVDDPTPLARQWAAKVSGRWFWLDQQRSQSRVLLPNKMNVDFAPLRASTITEDQLLRDFTINSLAFPLQQNFLSAELLDPLNALIHLKNKIIQSCSPRSFSDDPLRMLKGIRHAATLDMQLTNETHLQIENNSVLIKQVAGERNREEIGKILSADQCFKGIELLIDTGLLTELFGPAGPEWKRSVALQSLLALEQQMNIAGLKPGVEQTTEATSELYSHHSLFLLARLLKQYAPLDLQELLQSRLRLSRQQQKLMAALQTEPSDEWFNMATSSFNDRCQALIVEQLGYAPDEQLLYLGLCPNRLTFKKALALRQSFIQNQQLGRIPDLLSGDQIRELKPDCAGQQIGVYQHKIKLAEIAGEIVSIDEAKSFVSQTL